MSITKSMILNTVMSIPPQKHGCVRITYFSEVKILKKSRKDGRPTPWASVHKLSNAVYSIGHEYDSLILNQLKKLGKDTTVWESQSSGYSEKDPSCENGIVRQNKKNNDQKYIRAYQGVCSDYYEEIFLDASGNVLEISYEDKCEFFSSNPDAKDISAKQESAGIEKEISPRELKADSIKYFQFGEYVYNNLSKKEMDLLNLELVKE